MGCASSKQKKCRHCQAQYPPPTRRSFSMNVHHPPVSKGDTYHVVALTSSTLGSIKLDPPSNHDLEESKWVDSYENDEKRKNFYLGIGKKGELEMDMIEAKAWSKMIDEKITRVGPKTPIRTPPCEPESIDVKDLMEGLEDDTSPLRNKDHLRSFSFHVSTDSLPLVDSPRTMNKEDDGFHSPKPTWFNALEKENNVRNEDLVSKSIVSELDHEAISSFRKAFEELSPTNPFHLKRRDCDQQQLGSMNVNGIKGFETIEKKLNGIIDNEQTDENKINVDVIKGNVVDGVVANNVYDRVNGFVEKVDNGIVPENVYPQKESPKGKHNGIVTENGHKPRAKKERVVLYFTSLRGVRKTYEDCCYVKLILKGFRVRVDEKDVSMHSGFKEELRARLDEGFKGGLPKVFVGERYIGGADEMRQMHEDGLLEKVLKDCEILEDDSGNLIDACEACGDIRFVPCETCSGSCKIFFEYDDDNEEFEEDEYGFQRCPDCNENGLVRCPICCE